MSVDVKDVLNEIYQQSLALGLASGLSMVLHIYIYIYLTIIPRARVVYGTVLKVETISEFFIKRFFFLLLGGVYTSFSCRFWRRN